MEVVKKYFGDTLTAKQLEQFEKMRELYAEWNAKINVISRKDFDSLYLKHVLHSLAIARVCQFEAGARILDVGCGGGFPSVPLAVMFPEAQITAVDSIGKKIKVVEEVSRGLGLSNLKAVNARVESIEGKFDFVVSRAVAVTSSLMQWTWSKIERGEGKGTLPNGMLLLKGGDLAEELALARHRFDIYPIKDIFEEEFFAEKVVVYGRK